MPSVDAVLPTQMSRVAVVAPTSRVRDCLVELARSGQTVEIEPKSVTVHGLSLRAENENEIDLTVETSTGF